MMPPDTCLFGFIPIVESHMLIYKAFSEAERASDLKEAKIGLVGCVGAREGRAVEQNNECLAHAPHNARQGLIIYA